MTKQYSTYEPVPLENRKWPSKILSQSPTWCAVDLRDGNQALANPMTIEQKKEYFKLLCDIGFKQIEIGFPSASRDEFDFTRELIENNLIPDDVTISVLTQAREHLVEKTLDSLVGAKSSIVHFYLATSKLHYKHVFGLERDGLIKTAETCTRQIKARREQNSPNFIGLEFSPEEFTDTDLDFGIEICDAVVEAWEPRENEKVILNLPATVERRPPTHYADMIENFRAKLKHLEQSTISLHAHNDQGCAIAATEMALMAGADRVEGTLFGHGERTGNVDLITMALNFQSRNIDTGLSFKNLTAITETVSRITQMTPHERHPYAGELVFTAFSGSHQDAISKCLIKQDEVATDFDCVWKIPYLHIDPSALGRSFEKFIRINSQSGKGGIRYIMEKKFGIKMPKELLLDFAKKVQGLADASERELDVKELWALFEDSYLRCGEFYKILKYFPRPDDKDPNFIHAEIHAKIGDKELTLKGTGNGPISAFAEALRAEVPFDFTINDFKELSLNKGADAQALAYIALEKDQGVIRYGVGVGTNIDQAGVQALVSGLNQHIQAEKKS